MWFGHGPRGGLYVEVLETRDGMQHLRVDGADQGGFSAVGFDALTFSSDGAHLAVPVRLSDGQWTVLRDGELSTQRWDGIAELHLSPDGQRQAVVAKHGERWFVSVDDTAQGGYDAVFRDTVRFSPDGARLVYAARSGDCVHVVTDGQPGACFDGVASLRYGDGGDVVAYLGRRDSDVYAVVDDLEHGPWADILFLRVAARGARVVWAGRRGFDWEVVVDGAVRGRFDEITAVAVSETGSRVAWIARLGSEEHVYADGRRGHGYDLIVPSSLQFGGELEQVSYVARDGALRVAIIDGAVVARADRVSIPVFATEGSRYALTERDSERWWVVSDSGKSGPWIDAGRPVFSGDGSVMGFVARDGWGSLVSVQSRTHRFARVVDGTLVLGPSGRHWAVMAGGADGDRWHIALDGRFLVPLPLEEIAAIMRRSSLDALIFTGEGDGLLRDRIALELIRYVEGPVATVRDARRLVEDGVSAAWTRLRGPSLRSQPPREGHLDRSQSDSADSGPR